MTSTKSAAGQIESTQTATGTFNTSHIEIKNAVTVYLIPFECSLKYSETVLIREVGPGDRDLLKVGFDHLSPQSRHFQFLYAHPKLTDAELGIFAAMNGADHVAIGALKQSGSNVVPFGIARYVRLVPGDRVAEFADTIVDDHKGLGLGSLLLGVLAKHAVLNGVTESSALVDGANDDLLGLLDAIGDQNSTPAAEEAESASLSFLRR